MSSGVSARAPIRLVNQAESGTSSTLLTLSASRADAARNELVSRRDAALWAEEGPDDAGAQRSFPTLS